MVQEKSFELRNALRDTAHAEQMTITAVELVKIRLASPTQV
jgi:hypothetical protein